MIEHTGRSVSPRSYTIMFHLGGAVADIAPCATAYSRRDITHEINVNALWLPHQDTGEAERAGARSFLADLAPMPTACT